MRRIDASWSRTRRIRVFEVEFVVTRDVAWLLCPFDLFVVLANDRLLNHFATFGVDWMGDIGVELGAAVGVLRCPAVLEP